MKGFSLQLKPVGSACNIACEYCYVAPFRPKHLTVMSDEVLSRVLSGCITGSEYPVITWHGGEPTLAGYDFFARAIELMEQFRRPSQEVWNVLQTNATLISPRFAELLSNAKFEVSISLDGPQHVHNLHRIDRRGRPTFAQVSKGIETLRSAGFNPAVIATVTQSSLPFPTETLHFLVENGFRDIKYSPVYDSATDRFSITSNQWFGYLKAVFLAWIELADADIHIRELDEVIAWLDGSSLSLCSSDQTCLNWVSVDPDGNLYPCEYLRTCHSYGNIMEMCLADIILTPTYQAFRQATLATNDQCSNCRFQQWCGNGCPATRITPSGQIAASGVYVYCRERQKLYNLVKTTFAQVLGDPTLQKGGTKV